MNEGPAPALRPLPARGTLAARGTILGPVRNADVHFAGRRASYRLAAFLGRGCQDASNPFLQPTFTSRAPVRNTSFGDYPSSAVGNPPTFDLETAFCLGLSPSGFERRRTTLRSSDLRRLRA